MTMQYGQLADRGTVKALQTRFSLSPDFSLNLSPEIAAVIPFDMPELLMPQGWRRWQRGSSQAPVAAQNGQARIGNRDNTNQLIIVERVLVSSGTATEVAMNTGTAVGSTSLGTLVTGATFRDSRHAFANPMAELSTTTTAAPFTSPGLLLATAVNTPLEIPGGPWVLLPGSTLTVQLQVVNIVLDFVFVWRERLIQEQENTP